ncbi:tetratricopeptide repeat protein [Streptomyces sp900129855]|uniref:Tetratricopeptide repeat protein n=1 Tax=Streptomyces sp. 900129855 TaxID=3155129 RepID=A0ABV2ZTL5_9ACTN
MNTRGQQEGGTSNRIDGGFFFHAVVQGRDITLQLPQSVQPALLGLPVRSAAFTGRDRQMWAILDGISPSTGHPSRTSIFLISGLGGIGKTELALQVAHSAIEEEGWFSGGVLFIDLFGYDEQRYLLPERALASLLQSLGVPEEKIPDDAQSRSRLYRSILSAYADGGRRILVVIDNASSADQVSHLLPADNLNVAVVTSRHTLSIGARIHELGVLDEDSSVEVLRSLLIVALGEEEVRIDADIEGARLLAWLCGHLPLALQICAALLADSPRRPVSSLVNSLQLAHNRIDQLHREDAAVRAVFDLSYGQLSQHEKEILGFLSFSPGPDISTAAAARLIDEQDVVAEQLLVSLSRAHLIEQGSTWGRWRLHDLVRLYALEAVAEMPGQEAALVRLLTYYSDAVHEASQTISGSAPGEIFPTRQLALEWLDDEHGNLMATVHVVAAHEAIAGYGLSIAHGLARYFDMRRFFGEWKAVMDVSLEIVQGADYHEARPGVLDSLGMAYRELHQIPASLQFHEEAVRLARERDDEEMLARFLNNMGVSLTTAHEYSAALESHSEAAALFAKNGNALGVARASDNSANALRELGRAREALDKHRAAIEIFRDAGEYESEARALTHMGSTLHDLGQISDAVVAHRDSAMRLLELSRTSEAAYILNNLATALRMSGDVDGALSAIGDALQLHKLHSDHVGQARAYNLRGLIYADSGNFDQAVDSFEESRRILSNFDDLIDAGYAHGNLGRVLVAAGRLKEAVENLEKAADVFSKCRAEKDGLMVRELIGALSSSNGSDGISEDPS